MTEMDSMHEERGDGPVRPRTESSTDSDEFIWNESLVTPAASTYF